MDLSGQIHFHAQEHRNICQQQQCKCIKPAVACSFGMTVPFFAGWLAHAAWHRTRDPSRHFVWPAGGRTCRRQWRGRGGNLQSKTSWEIPFPCVNRISTKILCFTVTRPADVFLTRALSNSPISLFSIFQKIWEMNILTPRVKFSGMSLK